MLNQMKNVAGLVEQVLQEKQESRRNDLLLLLSVWKKQGLSLSQEQEDFILRNGCHQESVRRTRQKLQEGGKYLPDEATAERRKDSQRKMRDHFSGKSRRVHVGTRFAVVKDRYGNIEKQFEIPVYSDEVEELQQRGIKIVFLNTAQQSLV